MLQVFAAASPRRRSGGGVVSGLGPRGQVLAPQARPGTRTVAARRASGSERRIRSERSGVRVFECPTSERWWQSNARRASLCHSSPAANERAAASVASQVSERSERKRAKARGCSSEASASVVPSEYPGTSLVSEARQTECRDTPSLVTKRVLERSWSSVRQDGEYERSE
jgi:hypothetical protein